MKKNYRNIDLSICLGCWLKKHYKNIIYIRFVHVPRPSASIQSTLKSDQIIHMNKNIEEEKKELQEVVNLLNMDIKGRASKVSRIMKNSCGIYCAGTVSCEAKASHLLFAASSPIK